MHTLTHVQKHPSLPPYIVFCPKDPIFEMVLKSCDTAVLYWSEGKLHNL